MSMPLKEWLVKKLSQQLHIPERIIDTVITDQFTSAFRATSTHNSIELSGFGKFVFNQKKAHRWMDKYESQNVIFKSMLAKADTERDTRVLNLKLDIVHKNIEHLKPKLVNYESKANIRGVEEPHKPSSVSPGEDS
jgi:nucleoid DNA-binding protein